MNPFALMHRLWTVDEKIMITLAIAAAAAAAAVGFLTLTVNSRERPEVFRLLFPSRAHLVVPPPHYFFSKLIGIKGMSYIHFIINFL
jgi:hypothetical protein